jgi:Calcineurin-like phosphoesterase
MVATVAPMPLRALIHRVCLALVVACLVPACPSSPYTPGPGFARLSRYRVSATASLRYAALHFDAIYGHQPLRLGGLQPVRPRLGVPALVQRGTDLEVAYLTRATQLRAHHLARGLRFRLVRAGKPCLPPGPGPGPDPGMSCYRLGPTRLVSRTLLPGGVVHLRVRARIPDHAAAGLYDLIHQLNLTLQIQRVHSAVRVFRRAPDDLRPFTFVHLTDTHQSGTRNERLRLVVRWLNRLRPRPDFAVLTGDVVDLGPDDSHWTVATEQLRKLRIPLFVVPGNHDYYRASVLTQVRPPAGVTVEEMGLRNYMRYLHPYLAYRFRFAGYRFLAVDTGAGATTRSLWKGRWITTRGLSKGHLADIRRFLGTPASVGHVLFGHAPSRARYTVKNRGCKPGRHATFLAGRTSFEAALLSAWRQRNRPVVYLSGHTHWSDVYARGDAPDHGGESACRFRALSWRHRHMGSLPCWRRLPRARFPLLITTQSATRHNKLRSGGLLQRGMKLGDGAGAGFGFRVLHVRGTRWLSAAFRFYHRTTVMARRQEVGFIHPRSNALLTLPACSR